MQGILRMARELGEAIARDSCYQALRRAEEAVKADARAKALIDEFSRQQEKILSLADEGRPIEADDKRRMADLQQQVASNEALKNLQAAQVDFRYLMDSINRAIHQALEPPGEEDQEVSGTIPRGS